ncbi:MAG: 50S ribosomal protein L21 [Alphaproteobacteria bacterium]|nr:50S ribosomal protein L21 [Alphaproteobacteria bacterium]
MFAIIKTGGKQYKVAANDIIRVEKLVGASGDHIEFSDVLMAGQGDSIKVGAPLVTNAMVCGTVLDQIRDDKIIIFKKKKRHNYRRKNGHRQSLTVIRITDILLDGAKRKAPASPEKIETQSKTPVQKATPLTEGKKASSLPEEMKTAPVKKATVKSKKPTEKLGD